MEKILWIVAVGFVGAYVAKKRKLNPFFWFAVCFMLGLTALLGFIFLPFFLKKWKKKSPPVKEPAISLAFPLESLWYYLEEDDTQNGPMSFLKLQQMMQEGKIQENTYIWNENFSHWKLWKDVFPTSKQEG